MFTCDENSCFYDISKVNLFEITVCLPPEEEIWTKEGLRPISSVSVGDNVLTHKARWRGVTDVMSRYVDEGFGCTRDRDGYS